MLECAKIAKEYAVFHDLENCDRFIDFFLYWYDCIVVSNLNKPISEQEVNSDCARMALNSYHAYELYESRGHSVGFCRTVSHYLQIYKGLFYAYRALTRDERYNEALEEYRIRGFSAVYCQRIALNIASLKLSFLTLKVFQNIEKETKIYDDAFVLKIKENRPIWQAYVYADNLSRSGKKYADDILRMVDEGTITFRSLNYKTPQELYSIIFPHYYNRLDCQ